MTSYDSQRRYSNTGPPPNSRPQYGTPPRNPDYNPYAQPPVNPGSTPYSPYSPSQPIVVGTPPQHPGLRRESLSYQPPPNPPMGLPHPGLPQSSSYNGSHPEQYFKTPPQDGSYFPQGTPPSQGAYFPQGYQSQQPQQYSNGNQQQYAGQQPSVSYPPQSYPQNLHPAHAHASRRSQDYNDDSGIRFDDSVDDRPSSSRRPRAYSSASRTSRRSRGSDSRDYDDYDDDDDDDYERRRRSSHSDGSHKKHRRYSEEPRVTVGDSMMWALKKGKELLSSKRE